MRLKTLKQLFRKMWHRPDFTQKEINEIRRTLERAEIEREIQSQRPHIGHTKLTEKNNHKKR